MFRSIGLAATGFVSTYVTPGSAGELLTRAEAELSTSAGSAALRSDAAVVATGIPLWARSTDAFYDGKFEQARDLALELVRSFARTTHLVEGVCAQSLAEVLLGQPAQALVTVAQLDELDLTINDGNDVRALAHLALGDIDTAVGFLRRFATRAALGVLPSESNDAMLLLASLALHQGDDAAARAYLLDAGSARPPAKHPRPFSPSRPTARRRRRTRRRHRRALPPGQPARSHGCDPFDEGASC